VPLWLANSTRSPMAPDACCSACVPVAANPLGSS
jgi:hypothetical protein